YDVIAVEDLQIKTMVCNGNLAQRILDASWGKFIKLLCEKAARATRRVVKVNPKGTSEGLSMDNLLRDYISACRILNKSGLGRPVEPVERRPLLLVTAKAVIEGQVFSMKQEAPCVSGE
ncbi:MAG: RNA-guided endonuclease InsQ/TnpB family protein, partial [Candidatus Freyarchaeota archaeon]